MTKDKRGRKKAEVTKSAFIIQRLYPETKDTLKKIANSSNVKLSRIIDYAISEFIERNTQASETQD